MKCMTMFLAMLSNPLTFSTTPRKVEDKETYSSSEYHYCHYLYNIVHYFGCRKR